MSESPSDPAPAPGEAVPDVLPRWTFLTNHTHVLIELHSNPNQVLRQVATKVGITERAVQRIVQELEREGYLERERVGRQNRYRLLEGKHLRHPIESHCKIDDLLRVIVQPDSAGKAAG